MPGEPVKVELKPSDDTQGYCGEFVECWHPNCQEYYLNRPLESSPVIYMFCSKHAKPEVIKAIHEFILEGKPIENPEIETLLEIIGQTIRTRIPHQYWDALSIAPAVFGDDVVLIGAIALADLESSG